MSALSNAQAEGGIGDALLNATRPIFAKAIWAWFNANKDRVVFAKWGFIRITVGAFRPIIAEIAGPEPAAN